MVGPIDIRINAAHPNIPLAPLYAFIGSPSSVRVRGVPLRIGKWDITAVNVTITLPDNSATTVPAVPVAGCWVATLPSSPVTGYCAAGLQVTADGLDENGAAVTGYCLGVGDVTILSRDASASADGKRYYLHYLEDEPEHPQTGDACYIGGVLKWYDGTSWRQFLDVVAPSTGATPGMAADAKATGDALAGRPTKTQIDEGWWSEWEIVDAVEPERTRIVCEDEEGVHGWVPQVKNDDEWSSVGTAKGDSNSTDLTWIDGVDAETDVTATRHRVAAPVPTKPEDIGAQPQGDYYQKPSGGIPKTDLASAVQTSLGLADTAVQPAGIAGLMPMYPFSEPTFAQTEDWTFSGTDAASGCHWHVEWESSDEVWQLYSVDDNDGTPIFEDDAYGLTLDATSITFSTAGVTATRGYVATLTPFTNAQIEMGWTVLQDGVDVTEAFGSLELEYDSALEALTINGLSYGGSVTGNAGVNSTELTWIDGEDSYTATRPPSEFEIAVGALPTGVTGKVRDCILVIDCTASGAVAPTVTWGSHFHPRTDTATDLAIVEAGKRAVFYISEYAAGEFAVGGWVETAGGSGT